MLYLVFNEGYSAAVDPDRAQLAGEAIRLTRLLLRLYQAEPEIMGLLALMLLQHARTPARFDAAGQIVLLDDQDRGLWDGRLIAEGLALIDKAMRHRRPGAYQVQAAIAALHARAATPADTDWAADRRALRSAGAAHPVAGGDAQPGRRGEQDRGARRRRSSLIAPLSERLAGYFHFHGLRGALNLELGRHAAAREAFDRAIALANTAAEAAHIRQHLDQLARDHGPDTRN